MRGNRVEAAGTAREVDPPNLPAIRPRTAPPAHRAATAVPVVIACVLLVAVLPGCSRPSAPVAVMKEQCRAIDGSQSVTLGVRSPADGTLSISIRERGIALSATVSGAETSGPAASPFSHAGHIVLTAETHAGDSLAMRIKSRDSRDIAGEACISAQLIPSDNRERARTEHAFAKASDAVYARDWPTAFREYVRAARGLDGVDPQRAAAARLAMAELSYRQLDQPRDAYALIDRALVDMGPRAGTEQRAAALLLQGKAALEGGRGVAQAQALFDAAHFYARRSQLGAREIPRIVHMRGYIAYGTGDPPGAGKLFRQAADLCEQLRDWECYANARQNLAALAEEVQDYTVALQSYADALRYLDPDVAPELAADVWTNLGRLQGSAGIFSSSERSYLNGVRLQAQLGNCDGVRRVLAGLGTMLVKIGSISDAFLQLDRAASLECEALLSAVEHIPASEQSANTLVADADTLRGVPGQTSGIRSDVCTTARPPATLSADGKFAVFLSLYSLSNVLLSEDDREGAQRCIDLAAAYAVNTREKVRLANTAGDIYLQRGEMQRGAASYQRALEVAIRDSLPTANEDFGNTYLGLARAALATNRLDDARQHAHQALVASSARGDMSQIVTSLQLLAENMRRRDEIESAARTLKIAAELLEQVPLDELDGEKRATYLATQHAVFADLFDLLATRKNVDQAALWQALQISERGRARSLRFALSSTADAGAQPRQAEGMERYRELLSAIAGIAASQDISTREPSLLDALDQLATEHTSTAVTLDSARFIKQLDALDATLIEYTSGKQRMFAFVVDGGHITLVPLADRSGISAAAATLHEKLRTPETARRDIQRASAHLSELVLWPLTQMVTRKRIVIVPDDALHTIPLAVMPWAADSSDELLLHRAEIAIMPSAAYMEASLAQASVKLSTPSFALLGDPVFRSTDWERECAHGLSTLTQKEPAATRSMLTWSDSLPRLPGTREEIQQIVALARRAYPGSSLRIQLGCNATREALRRDIRSAPQVLHIATHGFVDAYRPRLSALALTRQSAAGERDAMFTLLDILDARLESRLVVLSACDTSRGKLLPGEGILGPAQAFLQAGAESVVASHWRIGDAETTGFMRVFYHYLLIDQLPAAAALRRAQLDSAATEKSYQWAAFSLYGRPDVRITQEETLR